MNFSDCRVLDLFKLGLSIPWKHVHMFSWLVRARFQTKTDLLGMFEELW